MLDYGWKQLCSGLLALTLVAGMLPPVSVAAEETEATEVVEVLETEPVETTVVTEPAETAVTTEATEETVPETTAETVAETTVATEETLAETTEATEATLPENVAVVQAMIDALPEVETATAEDYDAVQAAFDAYEALTGEEKALIQGAEKFEALFGWFNEQVTTLETVDSGTYGDNLTWVLEDGTLTISGTGEMVRYTSESTVPWSAYRDSITTVVLEKGVTTIGDYAFYFCNLTSIIIPESVTSIGNNAFYGCSKLTSITIPEGMTSIGYSAFASCSSLNSITVSAGNKAYHCAGNCLIETASKTLVRGTSTSTIPDDGSVTSIGNYAFSGCNNLTGITIPEGVTSIGGRAFSWCSSLTSITIPASVTSIGDSAFYWCSSLTSIIIPESVTSIGDSAFSVCSSLTSITIPKGVTSIGNSAFYYCNNLTDVYYTGTQDQWDDITVGSNNEALSGATIHFITTGKCGENLTWVLDDGTLTISGTGEMEDYDWSGAPWRSYRDTITSVVIEEGVTSIGDRAFNSYDSLTSIAIPDGVIHIGDYVFRDCDNLTSVTIPASVTSIGSYAFQWCNKLTYITFTHRATDELAIGSNAFYLDSYAYDNSTQYCPTTVVVASAKNVHPAISQCDWGYRKITYISAMELPAQSMTIQAEKSEAEVGIEIPMTLKVEPADTTSDILWSIIPGTGTATVTRQGVVTGLTAGTVTVRAPPGTMPPSMEKLP